MREQISLPLRMSLPAILAQLSNVIMQYIDAGMVGSLGADASSAIGLIASSTWLFHGVCQAANA
ncbi:MAG: MATE family efflux transporter, partial [Oscillospiraceae bacterium]|nr:MATE family efflux transporter [Oscillospiraceae bacterium]